MTVRGEGGFEPVIESAPASTIDFEAWVGAHVAVMRRLAAAVAPGFEAEDIVQEALLRAWQKRDSYQSDRGSVRSWLLALTRDRARRTRTRGREGFTLLSPSAPEVDSAAPSLGPDMDLRAAIASLSRRQREVIVLFYYVDLSVEETALVLGCANGTVKSTLADARARLKTLLGDVHE